MFYHAYFILILVCSAGYCVDQSQAAVSLRPGGANVITKILSNTAYRQVSFNQVASNRRCWQTCDCLFCWCKKTVCSTSYYLKVAYRSVTYASYYNVYECAPGWRQQGTECPIETLRDLQKYFYGSPLFKHPAICTTVHCANGGNCTRPNVCNCASGWTDANCTTNVNECATNNGGCDHYCNDTIGSFNCSCYAGYSLQGKTQCRDINECITTNTTGCQQLCINQPGTYKCGCYNGYLLNSDNKTCTDIDECLISNGTKHGCSYRCNNTAGSYKCSCPQGYLLTTNGRDCADHDECMTGNNTCQQKCINHPGLYTCDCRHGYDLDLRDNSTCLDIDECHLGTDGSCAHICNNTIGGYFCQCRTGYQLASNNRSCNDINECHLGVDACSQRCVNVIGSFYCSCRHGYYLDIDLKTCISYPCQPISTPPYGSKSCTGFNTDDVCRFSCKIGYELVGSPVRVCMSDATWSGQDSRCLQKKCSRLQPPVNGYVYIPCASSYDSQCVIGCKRGYILDGPSTAKCSHREQWKPSISKCKIADLCHNNLCKNSGVCQLVNATSIQCNCTNTGFTGTLCDEGQVITPNYPILAQGNSTNVTFFITSPDQLLIFTPLSNELNFYPSSLNVYPNRVNNTKPLVAMNMAVFSNIVGDHIVKYSLSGPGSYMYKIPFPDMITVTKNDSVSSCSSSQTFPKGCYQIKYHQCLATNSNVVLYSTSQWNYIGKGIATDGIVSVAAASNVLPVSTKGIHLSNWKFTVGSFSNSCSQNSTKPRCSLSSIFASQFLRALETSFPSWFIIRTTGSPVQDINDAFSYLWTGRQLLNIIGDSKITIGTDTLFSVLLVTDKMILQVKGSTLRLSQSTKSKPHIVAVELCKKNTTPNVIVAFNLKSYSQLERMDWQNLFGSSGWGISFFVVQISQDRSILHSGSLNLPESFVGNLEFFGKLNSSMKNGDNIVMRGSTLLDFDLAKWSGVSPSQWKADIRGDTTLSMSVDYEYGVAEPFVLKFSTMIASIQHREYIADRNSGCRLDGQTDILINGSLNGHSLNTSLIASHLEISEKMQAFASISMEKYDNNTNGNVTKSKGAMDYEITSVILYINGTSKCGLLRFPNTTVKIQIKQLSRNNCQSLDGQSDIGVRMVSTVNRETILGNFVIFAPDPGNFLEVRLPLKGPYSALLSAKARLFGQVIPVKIKFQNSSLTFSTINISLFEEFPAFVNVSGRLKPWRKLSLKMRGVFSNTVDKASLQLAVETAVNDYIKLIVTQVDKRMDVTRRAQQLAETRANKTKALLEIAENRLQNASIIYLEAVKNLSVSTKAFLDARRLLYVNTSSEFNDTVKILQRLCTVSECSFDCVPGTICSMCNTNITGKTRNLCPSSCYRSVIERQPPYEIVKTCRENVCKNVTAERDKIEKQSSIKCGFTSAFDKYFSTLKQSKRVQDLLPTDIPEWLSLRMKNVLRDYLKKGKKKTEQTADGSSSYSYTVDPKSGMKCQSYSTTEWRCGTTTYPCKKDSFHFQHRLVLYPCETTCETKSQTEPLSSPCCIETPCVTRVSNMACRKSNAFCRIIRNVAIKKLSKAKESTVQPYKTLLNLQSSVDTAEAEVEKRRTNLHSLTTSRDILLKSYASTSLAAQYSKKANSKNEEKMQDALTLAKIWQSKTLPKLIAVTHASFDIQTVFDVSSVPVEILAFNNGSTKRFNITLRQKNRESFLQTASQMIVSAYYGKVSVVFRDEYQARQDKIQSGGEKSVKDLINLKRRCSLSVNYERGLLEVVKSLYDVTQRILQALENTTKTPGKNDNEEVTYNRDAASDLGLTSQDVALAKEEISRQQEIVQAIFSLNLINASTINTLQDVGALVFRDWFAVMETLFHDQTIECNGFTDCMEDTLDNMFYLYDNVTLPKALDLKSQITDIRQRFVAILTKLDFSAQESNVEAKKILEKLEQAKDLETFCASVPNITRQPNAINEINDGNELTLRCSAVSVPPPSYLWKKDGVVLKGQVSSELTLASVKKEDHGNYTCIAYNHMADVESTPSLVIVHTPPILTKQPPPELTVTIDKDFYLECTALSTSNPIKYQWYFKRRLNDAFSPLSGQTFPVYSSNGAKKLHQGIYKCQVSNAYGSIDSSDISLTVLDFDLLRPGVMFTAHIRISTVDHKLESQQGFYSVERGVEDDDTKGTVNTFLGNWICPLTSLTLDCVFATDFKLCYPDANSAGENSSVCELTFVLRGTNISFFNLSKSQEQNANSVADSVTQLTKAVRTLLNSTSRESHTVNIGTQKYQLLKDSVSVVQFMGLCDRGKYVHKNGYMCVHCPPGTFGSKNKVVNTCIPCSLHTYQPKQGQDCCITCPPGSTTDATGSKYITDCKGQYTTAQYTTGTSPQPTSFSPRKSSTTSESGLPPSTEAIEPTTKSAGNDSYNLYHKDQESGHLTWQTAVGVGVGIFFIAVVLVVMYPYFKKKRRRQTESQLQKIQEENVLPPIFDNPVFEQEEKETKRKEGIELSESPLYKTFKENHDDESISRSNPLYIALTGSSDA